MRTPFPGNTYTTGAVSSADGSTLGYRVLGSGPPVILLHGGMLAAQHFMTLAGVLAGAHTCYVPDRRGRGLSGPHVGGPETYSVAREVEDVQALVAATGATRIFGLSSGGLVALRAALATPALERVAVYEPPLSVHGSAPTAWIPRYERELAAGRTTAALVTALRALGTEPMLDRVPRFVLVPLMAVGARLQGGSTGDDVPIPALVPTQRYDMAIIRELADTVAAYATLAASVLLLGGSESPAWLEVSLDALAGALPHARRVELPGLSHDGPTDDGDPRAVGEALRAFWA